jgi:hypothetical protein
MKNEANSIGMYVSWIDPTAIGWRVDSRNECFLEIPAWIPLPEPYKAESEE